MINNRYLSLYRYPSRNWRKLLISMVKKNEKGEVYSKTLRAIYAKYHQIDVGLYSYGCFNLNNINAYTKVGRYCSFASGVCVFNANHPLEHMSLHPFFYNPKMGIVEKEMIHRRWLTIGHDVWFGRNSIITPAVKEIGNGAVIAAGAVVTKDVPAYSIVGGNPATILRYRFTESLIEKIESTKWWTKDIDELEKNLGEFTKPMSS